MKSTILCGVELVVLIGLLTVFGYGQSSPAASGVGGRAGTVTAVLENTSDKAVLIWTSDSRPQTLADVGKFRVVPGSKKKMVVNVGSNGQVKFTASAGPPPDKSSILGPILGNCIWRQEPNAPTKMPYVVFNGSGLTCGTTGR